MAQGAWVTFASKGREEGGEWETSQSATGRLGCFCVAVAATPCHYMCMRRNRARPHTVAVSLTDDEMAELRRTASKEERSLEWCLRHRIDWTHLFTADEVSVLFSIAERSGVSVSTFVAHAVRAMVRKEMPEFGTKVVDIGKVVGR